MNTKIPSDWNRKTLKRKLYFHEEPIITNGGSPVTSVGTQTDQFETSFQFWVKDVDNMRQDITQIKQLLVKFESILVDNQAKQLEFLQRYFDRQTDQLRACQEAFQLNVDRDEELRNTMQESADPWSGC